MNARTKTLVLSVGLAMVAACSLFGPSRPERVPSVPVQSLPGHDKVVLDDKPKAELRMVPAEAYVRTYMQLFGGLAPLAVQKKAKGADGNQIFDVWDDYLGALGFPDYRSDLPRATQTNALMVATFERLGVALCDRAVENDLKGTKAMPPPPAKQRVVFAFDLPTGEPDAAAFAARFDVLHRTFLGYPASLAPAERTARFLALYKETAARRLAEPKGKSRFSPAESGWASVCYGLVRHPEFHLY